MTSILKRMNVNKKWIVYSNVEWLRSCRKLNEPLLTTQNLPCTWRRWYCVFGRIQRLLLLWTSVAKSDTEFRQWHQSIKSIWNWKSVIFHHHNGRPQIILHIRQKLASMSDYNYHIHLTVPLYITTFWSLENPVNGKNSSSF